MKNNFYFLLISFFVFSMVRANDVDKTIEVLNNKSYVICEVADCSDSILPKLKKNEGLSLVEVDFEVDLGFDPYLFLSEGFDPFFGMELNIDSMKPMEEEAEVILDFDTSLYLPKNFNPYLGM